MRGSKTVPGRVSLAWRTLFAVSWRKLRAYFLGEREETGRATVGEWFQWLAERFAEREAGRPPVPAYVEFRDWRTH